jgi:hypothetical protein
MRRVQKVADDDPIDHGQKAATMVSSPAYDVCQPNAYAKSLFVDRGGMPHLPKGKSVANLHLDP